MIGISVSSPELLAPASRNSPGSQSSYPQTGTEDIAPSHSVHVTLVCNGHCSWRFHSIKYFIEVKNVVLDRFSPEQVGRLLGTPLKERVLPYNDRTLTSSAPKFIYRPADLMRLGAYFTGNIKAIDFGEAFFLDDPPEGLSTPANFSSLELLRDNKAGKESDVWALACTIYEMRARQSLFEIQFGIDESVLPQMERLLRPFPMKLSDSHNVEDEEGHSFSHEYGQSTHGVEYNDGQSFEENRQVIVNVEEEESGGGHSLTAKINSLWPNRYLLECFGI